MAYFDGIVLAYDAVEGFAGESAVEGAGVAGKTAGWVREYVKGDKFADPLTYLYQYGSEEFIQDAPDDPKTPKKRWRDQPHSDVTIPYDQMSRRKKKLKARLRHKLKKMPALQEAATGASAGPTILCHLSNGRRSGHLQPHEKHIIGPVCFKKRSSWGFASATGNQLVIDSTLTVDGTLRSNAPCEMGAVFLQTLAIQGRAGALNNPFNAYVAGSIAATADPYVKDIGSILHVSTYNAKYLIANTSSACSNIEIIIGRPKYTNSNCQVTLPKNWSDSLTLDRAATDAEAQNNAGVGVTALPDLTTGEVANISSNSIIEPSATPMNCAELGKLWKMKSFKFELQPGTQRAFIVQMPPTRFKTSDFRNEWTGGSTLKYVKNYSYSCVILAKGVPIYSSDAATNVNHQSISGTSCSIYKEEIFTCRQLELTHRRDYVFGDLTKVMTAGKVRDGNGGEEDMTTDEGTAPTY
ncbi:MAG: putative capsid protein [Cressdnaviricota sp.]|nr:MAG: putative capsid protein [Cressdnaviricota sp.]